MKGRLYDPTLRRFTTADPYVTEPLNPQGLNRYSYVQNNPMNATDPSGFQPFDYNSYSQQMSNYYSQQAEIQANIARFDFYSYLMNNYSGPATPPTNVPSIGDIAQMDSAGPPQTATVDWGQFNEMANQASARGLDQARAQQIQNSDAQRARDAGFTQPYTTPGTPMSYQTMMGFSGSTYGSNPYYPPDPIMNTYRGTADFLLFDNVRTLTDPSASTGERVLAGVGLAMTFVPLGKLAETGTALARSGLDIGVHAAERMGQRGITTSMIEAALQKGTPFIDPKNGSISYVLQGGMASGKDLLVGTNPLSGKITTVFSGWDLVSPRFIEMNPIGAQIAIPLGP